MSYLVRVNTPLVIVYSDGVSAPYGGDGYLLMRERTVQSTLFVSRQHQWCDPNFPCSTACDASQRLTSTP